MRRLKNKPCRICGKPILGIQRKDRKAFYYPRQCSKCFRKCRDEAARRAKVSISLIGKKSKPIGSKRISKSMGGIGYVIVKCGDRDWRYEHRVIAEQTLGRPLRSNEHAHHKNRNTLDNRPENIEVLTSRDHAILHHDLGNRWSIKFDHCVNCKTTCKRHLSHGLCTTCYQRKDVLIKFRSG